MFERFTDRARRVVVLAQEEARLLNHNYIGTEHLLLGLVGEEEGIAAKALDAMRLSLVDLRRDVEEAVGEGDADVPGHLPFTPRAKKVLELALREALQLGHNYIGTEHILLGLVREGDGVAAHVLQKRGADLMRVRETVVQLLSGYAGPEPPASPSPAHEVKLQTPEGTVARSNLASRPPEAGVPICPNCRQSLIENARLKRVELEVEGETSVMNIAYCHACGMALGIKVN